MTELSYERAATAAAALALGQHSQAKYLAGGTNLVDLMREHIEVPRTLVDVSRLARTIEPTASGGLRIGAGAKNTAIASDRTVRENYPLIAEAILAGASAQIRNVASAAGNVLQRTRCLYFYDDASRCNKRTPGAGCDALEGHHRHSAILGASPDCIATHPSDLCVALAALDAIVQVEAGGASRGIPLVEFHLLPGSTPNVETQLRHGELIAAIDLPAPVAGMRSVYRKVRDRASYAFAVVSAAVAVDLDGDVVRDVRIALGGVAHKPWRATIAEAALRGHALTEAACQQALAAELAPAVGRRDSAFKIELVQRVVVASLLELATRTGSTR